MSAMTAEEIRKYERIEDSGDVQGLAARVQETLTTHARDVEAKAARATDAWIAGVLEDVSGDGIVARPSMTPGEYEGFSRAMTLIRARLVGDTPPLTHDQED